MHYKYKKEDTKRARPCGRAASGRVAWRKALKKYAHKPGQNLLPSGVSTTAAGKVYTRTKKKGQKKAKKRHRRAKIYGLAARQGSGGREVVAASASLGAGLGVHFMPAAAETVCGQPCMHTFCRQNLRKVSG